MPYEDATTIGTLNPLWPLGGDPKSQGDDHIRMLKRVLQASNISVAEAQNRIVNPAMQISQENGTTQQTASGSYIADQWQMNNSAAGAVMSGQQTVAASSPYTDFARYRLGLTVATAKASLTTNEVVNLVTRLEGTRIQDFNWGLASAKPVVLRFGFRTNTAGTYGVAIRNGASDRSYVIPMTIAPSEALTNVDVWKNFVIPGDVTGTWPSDTQLAMSISVAMAGGPSQFAPNANQWVSGSFQCAPGCTNNIAAAGNYMHLSNVGLYLDAGQTGLAPPWVVPMEADELRACQRYWEKIGNLMHMFSGQVTSGSTYYAATLFAATKRSVPTVAGVSASGTGFANTIGTLVATVSGVREGRAANATLSNGLFNSDITASARL